MRESWFCSFAGPSPVAGRFPVLSQSYKLRFSSVCDPGHTSKKPIVTRGAANHSIAQIQASAPLTRQGDTGHMLQPARSSTIFTLPEVDFDGHCCLTRCER